MAAENYTAGNPAYPDTSGPNYLTWYTDALDANGVAYDIYDVDRRGNLSPDWLGVLSHYDAVIWYLGDDNLTRLPGQPPGTGTSRLAVEEMIDVRHFLNEGGKLFYTGKNAGLQYAQGNEFRNFGFPEPRERAASTATRTAPSRPADAGVRRGRLRRTATAASCTTTTSSSTTWGPTSMPRPATRSTTRTTTRSRCAARGRSRA